MDAKYALSGEIEKAYLAIHMINITSPFKENENHGLGQ
jgi:hypothetical protein